jgi:hypothetical protein
MSSHRDTTSGKLRLVSSAVSADFYAVAAQIIPVFFIALAFETQSQTFLPPELVGVRGGSRLRIAGACYTIVVTLFLVGGEVAALVGLKLDRPLNFEAFHTAWFVTLGLAVGGLGIVAPLALRQIWVIAGEFENLTPQKIWASIVIVLGVAVLFAYTVAHQV